MPTARVARHEPGCNYPFELSFDWVSGFEYDAARSIPILTRPPTPSKLNRNANEQTVCGKVG